MPNGQVIHPFAKQFEKLITNEYPIHQWLHWFVRDCLATWVPLTTTDVPPKETYPVLFALGRAYARAVASEAPLTDILGPVYMELASHGQQQHMKQFFTPSGLADLTAAMIIGERFPKVGETSKLIRIGDFAGCGAGSMLLAAARYAMNHNAAGRCSFVGIDLDLVCARITALQFAANSMTHQVPLGELIVYRGNGLHRIGKLDVVLHLVHSEIDPTEVPPAAHASRETMLQQGTAQAIAMKGQMGFEF